MNLQRRLVLLVNPSAANARDAAVEAAAHVLQNDFQAEVRSTASAEELARLVLDHGAAGTQIVVAGGDGTINVAVNAAAGRGIPLGLIPLGTANDLARQLGIPSEPAAAARRFLDGRGRRIDLLSVNDQRFCTAGGLGLVTRTVQCVDAVRASGPWQRRAARILGSEIYAFAATWTILRTGRVLSRIRISDTGSSDGIARPDHVPGLFVANQRGLAGQLTLPTRSQPDDGRFEICLIHPTSRRGLIAALFALRRNRPLPAGVMSEIGCHRAHLACEREEAFLGDGEILCRSKTFDLKILPQEQEFRC